MRFANDPGKDGAEKDGVVTDSDRSPPDPEARSAYPLGLAA